MNAYICATLPEIRAILADQNTPDTVIESGSEFSAKGFAKLFARSECKSALYLITGSKKEVSRVLDYFYVQNFAYAPHLGKNITMFSRT